MSAHKGFTLIELLVVIAIIAILSVVGIAAFKGVTGGARDSTRRADIDAIAKAYEIQKTSGYIALSDSQFASGKKPQDPNSQKGDYFNWLATDGSGFKVCASLDDNPNTVCNTPAFNCYCKFSSQGSLNPSSPVNQGASTNYLSGLGGSSSSSCDSNGTLYAGLIGYWKMDEASWNGTAGEVKDWAGSNHGTAAGGANVTLGKFGNAGNFDGINDDVDVGNGASVNFGNAQPFTLEAWVNLSGTSPTRQHIIAKGRIGAGPPFTNLSYGLGVLYYSTTDQRLIFQIYHSDNTASAVVYDYADGFRFDTGNWHHYVAEWDGTANTNGMKIYRDGNLAKQGTISSTIVQQSTAHLGIGRDLQYPADTINGLIDDVRIYNRALSAPEVSNLYNGGNGCI